MVEREGNTILNFLCMALGSRRWLDKISEGKTEGLYLLAEFALVFATGSSRRAIKRGIAGLSMW